MRLFGFKFSFKKEPRWVTRGEFEEMSLVVLEMSENIKSIFNAIEAARKRLERHIGKGDGDVAVIQPEPGEANLLPSLGPGDCPTLEQMKQLGG